MVEETKKKDLSRQRSLQRSKKLTIRVIDFLITGGGDAIVPGSGSLFKAAKNAFVPHIRDYFLDRTEDRLTILYKKLLQGDLSKDEYHRFIKENIDEDTYNSILNGLITDDETKKAPLYGNFLRSIALRKISQNLQYTLTITLKKLTYNDLQLARYIYICSHFDVKNTEAEHDDPRQRFPGGMLLSHLRNLFNAGLLDEKEKPPVYQEVGKTVIRSANPIEDYKRGNAFDNFVESVFLEEELTPKSMSIRVWSSKRMLILFQTIRKRPNVLQDVQKMLCGIDIKAQANFSIDAVEPSRKRLFFGARNILLLLDGNSVPFKHSNFLLENLKKSRVYKAYYVQDGKSDDWFSTVNAEKVFYLKGDSFDESLDEMKKYFSENMQYL